MRLTVELGRWTLHLGGGWRVYAFAHCDPKRDACGGCHYWRFQWGPVYLMRL